MKLELTRTEWQLCKEYALRHILLTCSFATSLISLFVLLGSFSAMQATELNDLAFDQAERTAVAHEHHDTNYAVNSPLKLTLDVLPSTFQPVSLLSKGIQFILPPLVLSTVVSLRQFFYPMCTHNRSGGGHGVGGGGITHHMFCLSGFIVASIASVLWCIFGVVLFVRLSKQFHLKDCVATANQHIEPVFNQEELCYGLLHVLCYIGEAVDCDLVEIGLLGFLTAAFLGATSSLTLFVSLVDVHLDKLRERSGGSGGVGVEGGESRRWVGEREQHCFYPNVEVEGGKKDEIELGGGGRLKGWSDDEDGEGVGEEVSLLRR